MDAYTQAEIEQLHWLFDRIGSLTGLRILEPGCGTGRLTEILAERVGVQGWTSAQPW